MLNRSEHAATAVISTSSEQSLANLLEQVTQTLDSGGHVDAEQLAGEYPQHAERLRELMPTMLAVAKWGRAPSEHVDGPVVSGSNVTGVLGDFRILRELGRGGMGTVFEAEQISMGRQVALKVLPFAALAHGKALQRFRNEVRAAAALDHPNIVSVYSVGEERGIHYYSMQLVQGQSLAELIWQVRKELSCSPISMANGILPDPNAMQPSSHSLKPTSPGNEDPMAASSVAAASTKHDEQARISTAIDSHCDMQRYRRAARLGVQAGVALQHAHDQGVLHRDIKPANLMLDADGKLYVADFGLARIEADAGMTMTGDIVGTLRYMAPEQALAKRVVIDQRADIYSLGATLYELLSLQPAFSATDRSELLKQIAFEDPPPLRKTDRHIPVDLETVVLKAMAKNPDERYQTAQELAGDLQAYLDDRPIKAKPPTAVQRIARWSRRHVGVVWTAVAALAIAMLILTASTAMVSSALFATRAAEQRAVSDRDRAVYNRYVADVRLAHGEWKNGHVRAAEELLDAHVPLADGQDHRGWEWSYLKSLCHQDLAEFRGHSAGLTAVAWSPDGQRLATASDDSTVRVWEAVSGREIKVLLGHKGRVTTLEWDPVDRRLASAGTAGVIRVWDVDSGTTSLEIDAKSDIFVWSPDGKRIASTGGSQVSVWDSRTGAELLKFNSDCTDTVVWSPDGLMLATEGGLWQHPRIKIHSAESGEELQSIKYGAPTFISDLSWSADGKRIAACDHDHQVRVWDAISWQPLWEASAHRGKVWSVSWSPDGDMLASAGNDGLVKLWDADRGEEVRVFRGHKEGVFSVRWRPDGNRIASASSDGTAKIWNPNQTQSATIVPRTGYIALSPDGLRIACEVHLPSIENADWDIHSHIVEIFDAETGTLVPGSRIEIDKQWHIHSLAWSPEGKRIALGCRTRNRSVAVKVIEILTKSELYHLQVPKNKQGAIRSIDWSPDGGYLSAAISAMAGSGGLVWNMSTGHQISELLQGSRLESVAWSPNGQYLATTLWGHHDVRVWDTTTWQEKTRFSRHPESHRLPLGGERMLAWSPDSTVLAAGTAKGRVIFWDIATGRETLSFSAHTAQIRNIALSSCGRRLATASSDGSTKIWDTSTGRHLLTLMGEVAFWSSDGKLLVTALGKETYIHAAPLITRQARE